MKNKSLLKSFTITELMVALLISSIAFSLAIFSMLSLQKQIYKYQLFNNTNIEKERFYSLLNKDFNECIELKFENNSLYCKNNYREVSYNLSDKAMRKQASKTDTFSFQITDINYHKELESNSLHLDIVLDKKDSLHFTKKLDIVDDINNTLYGNSTK